MGLFKNKKENSQISRNNFIFLLVEEIFYYSANAFYDVAAVVPVFIYTITNDMKLSGLAFTVRNIFFILPQLIMGYITSKLRSRTVFMKYTALFLRIPLFIFLIILLANAPPAIVVISVLAVCGFLGLADGLFNVPWLDFIGDTINKENRGKLFSYILFFGGIGGMISGFVITYILNLDFTVNIKYACIFGLGCFLLVGSTISYFFMKETARKQSVVSTNLGGYLMGFTGYLKNNGDFRNLMTVLILNYFSNLSLPLFIVLGKKLLDLSDSTTSMLVLVQISGMVIGGGIWGYLCNRFGNRFSIQTAVLTNMALPLTALISIFTGSKSLGTLLFCFIAFGGGAAFVAWPGFVNYVISNVKSEEKSVYIAILNTLTLPFTFLSLLGGFLAEKTGYAFIFTIVLVMCSLAFIFSIRLKDSESFS